MPSSIHTANHCQSQKHHHVPPSNATPVVSTMRVSALVLGALLLEAQGSGWAQHADGGCLAPFYDASVIISTECPLWMKKNKRTLKIFFYYFLFFQNKITSPRGTYDTIISLLLFFLHHLVQHTLPCGRTSERNLPQVLVKLTTFFLQLHNYPPHWYVKNLSAQRARCSCK